MINVETVKAMNIPEVELNVLCFMRTVVGLKGLRIKCYGLNVNFPPPLICPHSGADLGGCAAFAIENRSVAGQA